MQPTTLKDPVPYLRKKRPIKVVIDQEPLWLLYYYYPSEWEGQVSGFGIYDQRLKAELVADYLESNAAIEELGSDDVVVEGPVQVQANNLYYQEALAWQQRLEEEEDEQDGGSISSLMNYSTVVNQLNLTDQLTGHQAYQQYLQRNGQPVPPNGWNQLDTLSQQMWSQIAQSKNDHENQIISK